MENNPNQSDASMPESSAPQPKSKGRRNLLIAAAGVAGVALFGGAAYVAGRLLAPKTPADDGPGALNIIAGGPGQSNAPVMRFKRNVKPAPELPATQPDTTGLFVRRQDKSIFVGTGQVKMMVKIDKDTGSGGQMSSSYDGPVVEVVTSRNTTLYKDVTPADMQAMQNGDAIQQKVEPMDSLDKLLEQVTTNDVLSAWGEKTGDRVVARVLVYSPPQLPSPPPKGQ